MAEVVSLGEAVGAVSSGHRLGVGGMMLARRPVAACRAVAEIGRTGLEVIGLTCSVETDLLIQAGAVATLRTSMISLGLFGFAPSWAEAVADGRIDVIAETEMSIVGGLRARLAGVGFEPAVAWQETDYLLARPDVKSVRCPYTGDEYVAFPRVDVDVALVHALAADQSGNAYLGTDLGVDRELARCASTTILSAERLMSTDELLRYGEIDVPGRDVDFVVEVPGGARPTSCEPDYAIDADAFLRWSDHRVLEVR